MLLKLFGVLLCQLFIVSLGQRQAGTPGQSLDEYSQPPPGVDPPEEVQEVHAIVGEKVTLDVLPVPIDQADQVREGASPAGRYPCLTITRILRGSFS